MYPYKLYSEKWKIILGKEALFPTDGGSVN